MVKKTSIFARLAERWRSASGLKVASGKQDDAEPVLPSRATMNRVSNGGPPADVRSTRKLSDREEAMVAIGTHFQDLASLMRGVHSRMDTQVGKLGEAAEALAQLPALGNQQLELLRGLSGHMERQNVLGDQIARSLSGLPNLLQNVETALQRAAASDERTATTVRDFHGTLEHVQASMGKIVEHSESQAQSARNLSEKREESLRALAQNMEQVQQQAVADLRTSAHDSMQTLRRSQDDQTNRLQKAVREQAGWNKAVLAVLGFVVLVTITMLVMQLVK